MQNFLLQDAQNDVYTPQYLDAGGNPSPAPAVPISYTLFDDFGNAPQDKGLIVLTPAADTLSVRIAAVGGLGTQRVRILSGSLSTDFTVSIGAGPAVACTIIAGTPQAN